MRPQLCTFFVSLTVLSASVGLSFISTGKASGNTASDKPTQHLESPTPRLLTPQLRWGRAEPKSNSAEILSALNDVFEKQSGKLNFAKRDLTNLLEDAMPRKLGRLFPFRRPHSVPENLIFENFGQMGFLIGETDPLVPPILTGTDTAEWVELRGPETISMAREFTPPLPITRGLRSLGLQRPWVSDIFSTTWYPFFEMATGILENGGLRCWNKTQIKKTLANLPEPGGHFRCSVPLKDLTQEAALPKQLPNRIGAQASVASSPSNPPSTPPVCTPMGRLNRQSLELVGDDKSGHCLLWRNLLDERFLQKSTTSKLICLNARHKSFQKTRFNAVVAVLPSSRADTVRVLESEDGLLSSYRLSLATLSVSKEEINVPSGQNLRSASFPRQLTGLYACRQSPVSALKTQPTSEFSVPETDWIYVDDVIYSGLRPTRPETDTAWRIRESASGSLEMERLSWSQLQYDHPSITNERPFACVAGREIDARCGLRVLQTAMQLSEEWLNGDFDKNEVAPAVQLATSLLLAQSLEKVGSSLPDWSLRTETDELLKVFNEKIKQLVEDKTLIRLGIKVERSTLSTPQANRYLDLSTDSPDYNALKKLLSSSTDFWAQLRQKSL